ncbi:MAG: SDR family NAD(P)-dependent oxidoreductase, partial [Pseudomonadota bacterium]|nr:SDR family NAD(P)-dependent oxidoreductase [Pseudomonadota bacterium]
MSLTGKTSIITGGSDGIGRAIAAKLAREGAHIVICARNAEKLESVAEDIKAAGGSVETRVQDVADTDSFAAMIEDVASSNGLDILVNNA